jgi:thymidylate synthase (FAD)
MEIIEFKDSERLMDNPHLAIRVLDHGYVRLVEDWGYGDSQQQEAGIVEAARQSTQGSFRGWEKDEKLLKYMYNARPPHSGPFEFAGMVLEIQAPIMVFREWHRHRTQSYAEMSARYAPLPDLNYIPTLERLFLVQEKNKQSQPMENSDELTKAVANDWLESIKTHYNTCGLLYKLSLSAGIPKELARLVLPVGRYSRMRASANLRNWCGFLTLRYHPDAQWEIQQFAQAVAKFVEVRFPRTWDLFNNSRP